MIFKNYKKLYEVELNNRKLYEQRYYEIMKKYKELQKNKGIDAMRKKIMALSDRISFLKEDRARLYIKLEDARNELDRLKYTKRRSYRSNGSKRKEILHK